MVWYSSPFTLTLSVSITFSVRIHLQKCLAINELLVNNLLASSQRLPICRSIFEYCIAVMTKERAQGTVKSASKVHEVHASHTATYILQ